MDSDDAFQGEMRRLQGLRPTDPPPLDPDTVEWMLVGAVDPADAPPGYAGVVRVLAAVAAEPSPAELAGEGDAVATFRAARRPLAPSRRKPVLGKLASVKALVAVAAGVVSIGTAAAAATGALPDRAQDVAHRLVAGVPGGQPASQPATPPPSTGPAGALPGAAGLCHAWAAGQGGEHGKKLDATAFGRLASAAGGADKVAGYCTKVTAAAHPAGSVDASQSTAATRPDEALVGLCRAWLAAEAHHGTAQLDKAIRDQLAVAAGGADQVTAWCTAQVGDAAAPSQAPTQPTHPQPPVATPTSPGSQRHIPAPPSPRG